MIVGFLQKDRSQIISFLVTSELTQQLIEVIYEGGYSKAVLGYRNSQEKIRMWLIIIKSTHNFI